jgi:hypothetical protein
LFTDSSSNDVYRIFRATFIASAVGSDTV